MVHFVYFFLSLDPSSLFVLALCLACIICGQFWSAPAFAFDSSLLDEEQIPPTTMFTSQVHNIITFTSESWWLSSSINSWASIFWISLFVSMTYGCDISIFITFQFLEFLLSAWDFSLCFIFQSVYLHLQNISLLTETRFCGPETFLGDTHSYPFPSLAFVFSLLCLDLVSLFLRSLH